MKVARTRTLQQCGTSKSHNGSLSLTISLDSTFTTPVPAADMQHLYANGLDENSHECNCGTCVTCNLSNALSFLHSVSLYSPSCPETLYVDLAGLKLTKIYLLCYQSTRIKPVCHCTWKALLFQCIYKRLGFNAP